MSITFGYISAWAKEPKEESGLKSYIDEYSIPKGIFMSGKINVKPDMAQQLIEYLQDPSNYGEYGANLDIAFFYDEDKSVAISGKLTSPYTKGDDTKKQPASTRARRTV